MKVGYARISSVGQSLDVQLSKLKDCEKVFCEKKSGRTTEDRDQLNSCLDFVRAGDTLLVTKLDRISRSVRDLLNIMKILENKGVHFVVLDQNIDTGTPEGRLMLGVLASIAEFENDLRKARQADGIEMARQKGVRFGRRSALDPNQVQDLRSKRASGVLIKDLMAEFGLSKASVYNYISEKR